MNGGSHLLLGDVTQYGELVPLLLRTRGAETCQIILKCRLTSTRRVVLQLSMRSCPTSIFSHSGGEGGNHVGFDMRLALQESVIGIHARAHCAEDGTVVVGLTRVGYGLSWCSC
jgi:hypothetical protein